MSAFLSPPPPPRGNRPGLTEIHTRIGVHGTFLASMLDRIGSGTAPGLAGLRTRALDDAAVALCDAWASIADVLTFYQERIANEGYLRTAIERRSIAEIARLVGYRMRPGVAASVHLAFTIEENDTAVLPVGVRVQTVPDGDEPARRFELIESLDADAAWNQLKVRSTRSPTPDPDLKHFFAAGITPPVRLGDAVILIANGNPILRRVTVTTSDFDHQRACIALAPVAPPDAPTDAQIEVDRRSDGERPGPPPTLAGLADAIRQGLDQAIARPPRTAFRLHQDLMRMLGPDTDISMRLRGMSVRDGDTDNLFAALGELREPGAASLEIHAMGLRTAPFGGTAPPRMEGGHISTTDWSLAEDPTVLYIEAIAGDIMPGTWIGFEAPPGQTVPPPRRVVSASIVARAAYGMAARCTRLQLDGPWIDLTTGTFAHLRMLTVYAGSTAIPLANDDEAEPIGNTTEIELDRVAGALTPGRWLIVEGELSDHPGARMSEVVMLASSSHVLPSQGSGNVRAHTVLRLANRLSYTYRRNTVIIWGNVARATEGETFTEVLGSGDGSQTGQAFPLARTPLTYVTAPTTSGVSSTLQIFVNGVTWHETGDLTLAGPNDRVFVVESAAVNPLMVRFGNGVNGARLPTGIDNVIARYRMGLGADGNCYAGQVTQLLTRPAGVRSVVNPRPASGGADPESRDDARRNASAGVTALDRLVGVQDFSDFARSFAGVGKADAILIHRNGEPTILVTIAGQNETQIQSDADLPRSLANALQRYGDPSQAVIVLPARNRHVLISARIGLETSYLWDSVKPRLRALLLDRFGFPRRQLGQILRQSEVVAAMHDVEGVAYVDLDTLASLPDPVTTDILASVVRSNPVEDVRVRPGRMAPTPDGRVPRPAEIAFMSHDMPELVALSEMTS